MLPDEAMTKLRGMLNQDVPSSAEFFPNEVLVKFLNSAQMEITTTLKSKQNYMRKIEPHFFVEALNPLIVLQDPIYFTREVALVDDFLFTHSLRVTYEGEVSRMATFVSYYDFLWQNQNSFQKATKRAPKYYIRGRSLGVDPIPPSDTGVAYHFYYKIPNLINGTSGIPFELAVETHEAIVWLAYSYAKVREQQTQEAQEARATGINLIKDL